MQRAPYGQPGYYRTYIDHVAACMAAQGSGIGGAGASPLLTDLAAYWTLNETSGTRFDSTANNNNLSDNGSVGSGIGVQGNAASFDGTAKYLAASDASAFQAQGDFTVACWIKPEPGARCVWAKWNNVGNNRQYALRIDALSFTNLGFVVSSNGTTGDAIVNIGTGLPITGVWYFVVVWIDAGTSINLQINNGTVATTPYTGGIHSQAAHPFQIGALDDIGNIPWDGLIDEVGIWTRILTSGERDDLYNSGSGTTFPFN